jgi:hypothetical protein
MLGIVHDRGQLRDFRPDLIGDRTQLGAGRFGGRLGEGGGDESGHDAPPALAGMGGDIPLKMHPTALPGRARNLGHRRLDALMRVRDDQLHARCPAAVRRRTARGAQAATGQLAEEFGPDRLGLASADFHARNLTATVRVDTYGDDDGD